jgi:hypothetical protein
MAYVAAWAMQPIGWGSAGHEAIFFPTTCTRACDRRETAGGAGTHLEVAADIGEAWWGGGGLRRVEAAPRGASRAPHRPAAAPPRRFPPQVPPGNDAGGDLRRSWAVQRVRLGRSGHGERRGRGKGRRKRGRASVSYADHLAVTMAVELLPASSSIAGRIGASGGGLGVWRGWSGSGVREGRGRGGVFIAGWRSGVVATANG